MSGFVRIGSAWRTLLVSLVAAGLFATSVALPVAAAPASVATAAVATAAVATAAAPETAAADAATNSLTVTVRNVGGTLLSGLAIYAIPVSEGQEIDGEQTATGFYPKAVAVTGKIGVYKFAALDDIDHTLYFATATSTSFSQLLGGASDLNRSEFVPAGQTALSITLASNSVISGVVKSAAGKVMYKALVTAYYYNGSEWSAFTAVRTDAKGKYTLRNLDPGSYRIKFEGASRQYSPRYSGGVSTFDAAAGVVAGVGKSTTVNMTFPKGTGSISGKAVTDFDNYEEFGFVPLVGAQFIAIPVTIAPGTSYPQSPDLERSVYSARSGKSGAWSVTNLVPGDYIVKISPRYYNQDSFFVGEYEGDWQSATVFHVTAGSSHKAGTDYATTYASGGSAPVIVNSIPGYVRVANAEVLLQSATEPDYLYRGVTNNVGEVTLGKSGNYHTIQPGKYTMTVTTAGRFEPQIREVNLWLGNDTHYFNLEAVTVPAGFVTQPTIAETALVEGTRYTVAAASSRPTATLSYQWLRDGRPIYGADEVGYTTRSGDAGTQISVQVAAREFGHPDADATAEVAGLIVSDSSAPVNLTPPSITSPEGARVGATLRVVPGTWSVRGLTYDFTWFRDGEPLVTAGNSHVVTFDDIGHNFTATVSARAEGRPDAEAATLEPVTPGVAGATELRSGFAVKSTTSKMPKGATKYTVAAGKWTAPKPAFTYEWLRNGLVIGSGSSFIEKPKAADLGFALEVRVRANQPGFEEGSATAVARKASAKLQSSVLPTVTIVGEATPVAATTVVEFGNTLRADPGAWVHGDDELGGVAYSYQWIRKMGSAKAASISGATGATYVPKLTDIGGVITLKVAVSSTRWAGTSLTVPAGKVMGNSYLEDTKPTVTLAGQMTQYSPIAAQFAPTWEDEKLSIRWYVCELPRCKSESPLSAFSVIPDEIYSTIYSPHFEAGSRIYFSLTATRPGSRSVTVFSNVETFRARYATFLVSPPELLSAGTVGVREEVRFNRPVFNKPQTITSSLQVCFDDCASDSAVWVASAGGGLVPFAEDLGSGESYVRVKIQDSNSYARFPALYTDSIRLVKGDLAARGGKDLVVSESGGVHSISWYPSSIFNSYATHTQRWFVDGVEKSSAATYTRTPADSGKPIYAVITASAPGFDDIQFIKSSGEYSRAIPLPVSPTLVGSGFGDTFHLTDPEPFKNLPQMEGGEWTYSYFWNGAYTASGPTYEVLPTDLGKRMNVKITVSSAIFGSKSITVTSSGNVLPAAAPTLDLPLATEWEGNLFRGTTVSVSPLSYDLDGVVSTYVWETSADGSAWSIEPRATAPTFTLTMVHIDRFLRVVVTGQKQGHLTGTFTSEPVQILEHAAITMLGAPALSGVARVGSTLTTTAGVWSEGATSSIQWMLNGRAIPGATGTAYVPLPTHAGDEISVRVTARQADRRDVVAETAAFSIQNGTAPIATKRPVISGTTTLTATPGVWTVSGLTFAFEWSRGGEVVGTGDTLTVATGTIRADYTLTVRATRFGYEPGAVTLP